MKKKIIALIMIVAIVATFVVSASGCGIISKNEDRVAKQNMITVTYKDLTDGVTENDVYSYLISTGYYQYITNYGMDAEDLLDSLANSLAQQKLAVLAARWNLAEKQNKAHDVDMSTLLRNDEYSDCIDTANKSLESQYKTYYDEIVKKAEKKEADETEEEKNDDEDFKDETLEARTTKSKTEDDKYTGADIDKSAISQKYFDYKPAEVEGDKNKQKALSKVTKLLEDNNTSYEDVLVDAMETKIVAKYRREVIEAGISDPTDAEIVAKYNDTYQRNLIDYTKNDVPDRTLFESAISSTFSGSVYQPFGDYGYVLQILIKMDDDQNEKIAAYKEYADEDSFNAFLIAEVNNTKVNVSNPDYDADAGEDDCTDEGYDFENDKNLTMKGVVKPDQGDEDYAERIAAYEQKRLDVINQHACSDPNCPLKAYVELDTPIAEIFTRIKADVDAATTTADQIKAFESWIYKVNDDSGIFNSNGYLITPEGQKSSYVAGFTALGRELVKQGAAAWSLSADRINEMQAADVDGAALVVNNGTVTFCLSEYQTGKFGIHILMTHVKGYTEAEVAANDNKAQNDLIVSYLSDEPTTLKQAIKDNMTSERKNNAYSSFIASIYKEAKDDGKFVRDDKKFQELVDRVKTSLGIS